MEFSWLYQYQIADLWPEHGVWGHKIPISMSDWHSRLYIILTFYHPKRNADGIIRVQSLVILFCQQKMAWPCPVRTSKATQNFFAQHRQLSSLFICCSSSLWHNLYTCERCAFAVMMCTNLFLVLTQHVILFLHSAMAHLDLNLTASFGNFTFNNNSGKQINHIKNYNIFLSRQGKHQCTSSRDLKPK